MFVTVPNPVVYEQTIFTVKVHCAAAAPKRCTGDVALRFKDQDLGSARFVVAPGKTGRAKLDLGGGLEVSKADTTIYVSIDPAGEAEQPTPYVKRRLLVRSGHDGGGPHSDYPFTNVVRDRRGDGAGPLDLRKAEAHVRNGRLIMTWTCWGTVTPAKMDHDSANFDARVYTSKPHGVPSRKHATVFYGDHGPVLFGGSEMGPNDWGGRFYRPNRHAVRISIPLRRYGRHIKQLWIEPATLAYAGGEDGTRGTIHFRVGK